MSDKPRRRFFQIHLSTAIVLSFVAGGLLWANSSPKHFHNPSYYPAELAEVESLAIVAAKPMRLDYGWPLVACQRYELADTHPDKNGSYVNSPLNWYVYNHMSQLGLWVDICAAFAMLLVVALLSEFLIRRKSRKPRNLQLND